MQYTLRLIQYDGTELARLGDWYVEGRAEYAAKKASRENTSPNVLVVIETTERKRGYPRLYRMGKRYYRP